MADLKEKIQKQIEFYFSDSNYPRDKFLRSLAAQNEEGFVPLNTIATFTRMKQLSEDIELVKEAVKASSIVQLNADGTMLKRIAALPDEDTSNPRTIYAKGFPHETGYTIEDVESVFAPVGKVLSVRIRKTKFDKKQKPSVFVELATAEEAKKATEAKLTFKDSPLTVMMKQDYTEQKKQERKTRLEEKKKRKSDDTESKEEVDESKNNNNNKKQKTNKPEEEKTSRISHSIAKFTGVGEKVTRENIKEIIGPLGTIAFVDFQQNESEGYIRFENEEQAKKAVEEFAKSPKELGGKTPTIVLLEADDEKAYWDKVHQGKKDFKKGGKGGKGKKQKRRRF